MAGKVQKMMSLWPRPWSWPPSRWWAIRFHMTSCGRTDAGVHAKTMWRTFKTDSQIPADRIPYALNTHLPEDIVVTGAMQVHDGFNAIGSCVRKEYTYYIYNSRIRDPFYVNRAWFYPKHLDETMITACRGAVCGYHDFAAVRSVGTQVKSTVRTVYYYEVERTGDLISCGSAPMAFYTIWPEPWQGTTGLLRRGKLSPEEIGLRQGNRTAAGPTVPPGGLYLTKLWYDDGKVKFDV